jgi:hypothetical protein
MKRPKQEMTRGRPSAVDMSASESGQFSHRPAARERAHAPPLTEIPQELELIDVPVVAAAVAGRANAIVTGDRDLVDDAGLRGWLAERGVEVLAPVELVARL